MNNCVRSGSETYVHAAHGTVTATVAHIHAAMVVMGVIHIPPVPSVTKYGCSSLSMPDLRVSGSADRAIKKIHDKVAY